MALRGSCSATAPPRPPQARITTSDLRQSRHRWLWQCCANLAILPSCYRAASLPFIPNLCRSLPCRAATVLGRPVLPKWTKQGRRKEAEGYAGSAATTGLLQGPFSVFSHPGWENPNRSRNAHTCIRAGAEAQVQASVFATMAVGTKTAWLRGASWDPHTPGCSHQPAVAHWVPLTGVVVHGLAWGAAQGVHWRRAGFTSKPA